MESTTDFDLEELESRLYSQVFHSTENWESQSATQSSKLNNVPTRHVSAFAVSNVPLNGKRYWIGKNIDRDRISSNENTVHEHNPNESINIESTSVEDSSYQQNCHTNFPSLESIIPLETTEQISETTSIQEYRTKPLRYRSYIIPNTLPLPKSKVKKLPNYIIKYFDLKNKERIKNFRAFLRYIERSHSNNNTKSNSRRKDSADQFTNDMDISPSKITITSNGSEMSFKLSDIPIPVKDDSVLSKNEEVDNIDNDIITLSDSDSDSVIEVPLPPIPIYNVDSSSESEVEDIEDNSYKEPASPKTNKIKDKYINPAAPQNLAKTVSIDDNNENNIETEEQFNENSIEEHSLQDCEINSENINNKNPVDMNVSFTELEKERDDFLHTPDTNDFIEHDVSSLNKNNFRFNFGLHSSDLDLSKDKEEHAKSSASTNDHDLYETESSCSEMGSISKSRPVFNEINFENPITDIFCEPDLSKFSNFITPNRNTQRSTQQNKIPSNNQFTPIETKAYRKNVPAGVPAEKLRDENKRRSRSESSEYHSDATTLKMKKKNKKTKKKVKKKEKLENRNTDFAISPAPTEELQHMEINPQLKPATPPAEQLQTENTTSKCVTPENIQVDITNKKSNSDSKTIENFKFGPSSSTSMVLEHRNSDEDKTDTMPEESKHANSTSPSSTNRKRCSSVADYYIDTYFADDCIMLEEIGKQNKDLENNVEASGIQENNVLMNNIQTADIATIPNEVINTNVSIPINTEKAVVLSNDVQYSNPSTSENGVTFSFVDTWRKSTDKNSSTNEKNLVNKTENETTPNKKLKIDNSPTVHPYVVTIESSEEDSESSEISVGKNEDNISRSVSIIDVDESSPDLILVNIKNDKTYLEPVKSPNKNIVANPFSFVNTYLQNKEKKSFKDFWTNDLKQFYDESWGQEDFDVAKAQSTMSGDPLNWKVISTDNKGRTKLHRRKNGPLCRRCREWGHTMQYCNKVAGPTCTTCGALGHLYTRCPLSFCTTCRNPSSYYTTKCRFCTHFTNIKCNLCHNVGHEMIYCPDLWRRYHLTTESHTELNTSSSVLKSPSDRWCSNCAKRGHCEDKCTYLRHEHFPTTPGIISYVPTYDEVFKLPPLPTPPSIPIFKDTNVSIADLRSIKNDVIQTSNKKYMNILKQLKHQCNKYDFQLINQIERLQRNRNNQVFSRKQIQEIHRIRARVSRSKIS